MLPEKRTRLARIEMKKKHRKGHKLQGRSRFPWESRNRMVSGAAATPFSRSSADANISSAANTLVEKISRSGPHYIEKNFVRIMRQCYVLRKEPEFRDLAFDVDETVEVSLRVREKYENRVLQLRHGSKSEQAQLRDEIRAEIIEELTTPDFRRDVLRRLDRAIDRLMKTSSADKLELALVLKTLLESKQVPWGLCGMMTDLYCATIDRAEQLARAEEEVFAEFRQAFKDGKDMDGLQAIREDPERLAALARKLEAQPGLNDHLQRETEKRLHAFEQAVSRREVELDLFTDKELLRPYIYLKEYVDEHKIDLAKVDQDKMAEQFTESIKRAIREIMTPERVEEMKHCLEQTSQTWLRAGNPHGALLQIELSYLETEDPSTNPFLQSGFLGQLQHFQKRMISERG